MVDLVAELNRRGLSVATVKHTHHHHELDTPGKDSHKHREAGAAAVAILAPGMTALFLPQPDEPSADARLQAVLHQFAGFDLVLVEGGQHCRGPKLEVWRKIVSEQPLALTDVSIRAVISDELAAGELATGELVQRPALALPRGDIAAIAARALEFAEPTS